MVRGEYLIDPDPMALPTALNKVLFPDDPDADIDYREVERKAREIMDERPAFVQLLNRHRVPHITRTLMRSFERGLKVMGERVLRERDDNDGGADGDGDGVGGVGEVETDGVDRVDWAEQRRDDGDGHRPNDENNVSGQGFDTNMLDGWGEGDADDNNTTATVNTTSANNVPTNAAAKAAILDGWGGDDGDDDQPATTIKPTAIGPEETGPDTRVKQSGKDALPSSYAAAPTFAIGSGEDAGKEKESTLDIGGGWGGEDD